MTNIKRIAVIGCGPGGMASALFLKRSGFEVVLFDQFAEPRPVGSGLLIQPSGQTILAALGLLDETKLCAAPVTGLFGIDTASGKRALDMEYRHLGPDVAALGIHRASLFDILFGAVQAADIRVQKACVLRSALPDERAVRLVFEDSSKNADFDLVINATGANSPLQSGAVHTLPFAAFWTTVDLPPDVHIGTHRLDQRYYRASKMVGIMPVGLNPATGNQGAALFWSVKPEAADDVIANGINALRAQFLELWPEANDFVKQVHSFSDLTLAIYRHRTGTPFLHPRIFGVGDAWHCTSPQLGQGANMALMDAFALSKAIEGAENLASIGHVYRHAREDHVRIYQWLSYVFTPLYQSDSRMLPMVRNTAIHHFAKLPFVRGMIAKIVSGHFGSAYI